MTYACILTVEFIIVLLLSQALKMLGLIWTLIFLSLLWINYSLLTRTGWLKFISVSVTPLIKFDIFYYINSRVLDSYYILILVL
jgi:hypothetical protein